MCCSVLVVLCGYVWTRTFIETVLKEKLRNNLVSVWASLNLHDAVCSLMFSKKPLGPSQNTCIYTEIDEHTCTLFTNLGNF